MSNVSMKNFLVKLPLAAAVGTLCLTAFASTPYPPMLKANTANGFGTDAIFTIGEKVDDYLPVGIPDGTAAYHLDEGTTRILVSHELSDSRGYAYELDNEVSLTGARISYFDLDRSSKEIIDAGQAYGTVYDRHGDVVTDAIQINEGDVDTINGFDRFCSAQGYRAGQYGFLDDIYFANEESASFFGHPHGGTVWALDVNNGDIWAAPKLGRGTWENVTALDTGDENYVALLLGDDFASSPLYLWIGEKKPNSNNFLRRNGLKKGTLYAWVPMNGEDDPEDFNGTGNSISGKFVKVKQRTQRLAGFAGYDDQGYADDVTLRSIAAGQGAFLFSRPEDLHTNPDNGTQVAFASTGRGSIYPSDDWGAVYQIDVDFYYNKRGKLQAGADLTIIYDGDDEDKRDFGLRNPDNLTWASDGYIYVQEDRSTQLSVFGADSGRDASVWQLNPTDSSIVQVGEMDRNVVAPVGTSDDDVGELGAWESSGIIDVTEYFDTAPGELLLFGTVQAHGIEDGPIGGDPLLDQGGQLLFMNKWNQIVTEEEPSGE